MREPNDDRAVRPRLVTLGEVMARLAATGHRRLVQTVPGVLAVSPAGAEANVAAGFVQLGGEAVFVSVLPRHGLADGVVAHLRGVGVDTRQIVRTEDGRLGLIFLEPGSGARPAQVIYDRAGSSFAQAAASLWNWEEVFRGATGFHLSGVTPAISRRAAELARAAVGEAVARRIPVSFDMNFRSRLWQWEPGTGGRELASRVVRELLPDVRLFLGGPDDVEMLTGCAVPPGTGRHEAAARLLASCWPGLQHVAMLRREALSATHQRLGAILLETASGVCHELPQWHDMESVVDRLGGGDAFAAGLLFALGDAELREPGRALAFAAAVSCLAHTVPGDFAMVSRVEAEALASGSGGGRVGR